MNNSVNIRVAVQFCLIAAIVIQPMAVVAAQGACAEGRCCEAETVCHACECCVVKAHGDLCGCCSNADERDDEDADSCCTNDTEGPKHDQLSEQRSEPEPPESDKEELVQVRVALSSCLCGIRSEPIAPAPQRVPVPQERELVVIAQLDHVANDAGTSIRLNRPALRLSIGDHSPHFTQRFLCIWRI